MYAPGPGTDYYLVSLTLDDWAYGDKSVLHDLLVDISHNVHCIRQGSRLGWKQRRRWLPLLQLM
jgi:hypothetical protein